MQFKNLTMSFGTQTIFEDVNLNIPDNVKIGVVALFSSINNQIL